jgi:hypothetical protein
MNKLKLTVFMVLDIILIIVRCCSFSENINFISLIIFVLITLRLGLNLQDSIIEFIYDRNNNWKLSNTVGSFVSSFIIFGLGSINYLLCGADKSEMVLYNMIILGAILMFCFRTLAVIILDE